MKTYLIALSFILIGTVLTKPADAVEYKGEEVIQLNVAFGEVNLSELTQRTVALLSACGRTIYNIEVKPTSGIKRASAAIHHVLTTPITQQCVVATQSVAVDYFGDFFNRANEAIAFLHTGNKKIFDFKITSNFNDGKPAAGIIFYCQ